MKTFLTYEEENAMNIAQFLAIYDTVVAAMPKHRRNEYHPFEQDYVYDHQYFGNLCNGFGGTAECEAKLWDGRNYETCGKSPTLHKSAKHRKMVF